MKAMKIKKKKIREMMVMVILSKKETKRKRKNKRISWKIKGKVRTKQKLKNCLNKI